MAIRSSRRFLVWVPLFGIILAAGCRVELDGIETILQRRSAALARLPEEDKAWKERVAPTSPQDWPEALITPGTLSQKEARFIGLRFNPDIHAARARIDQALARIAEARSTYYPTITLGHVDRRTFQTPSTGGGFSIPSQQPLPALTNLQSLDIGTIIQVLATPLLGLGTDFDTTDTNSFSQHTTSVSANWTLFDGLSREANVLAAKYTHGATKMSLADAQRLLVQAIDGAYYQAQLGRERLRITRADVEFSGKQLDAVTKRRKVGKATQGDVLNFKVRVLRAQANERAAIGLYENGRTALAELMGLDDAMLPDDILLSLLEPETESELTPQDPTEWVERAWSARPDLAQLEFELKSKTEQVKSVKGQFSPSILLSGSYGFDRLSNLAYRDNDQASAGAIELRWNLFTGGLRTSRLRQTEAERWELLALLRRRRQLVASQVRQSVTTLVNAQEQVRLEGTNLVAATENRRIVEEEFNAGKASLVRLNQAQRDLIETDAGLALARIRLRQAWTDLRAAAAVHRSEEG